MTVGLGRANGNSPLKVLHHRGGFLTHDKTLADLPLVIWWATKMIYTAKLMLCTLMFHNCVVEQFNDG